MDSYMQPLVSVIVPVYKVEKYLKNCLNSLINQTYKNWEAILVDDGSPDSSGEICEDYAARDPRFKVIHKPNGGLSSARNAGIDISGGKYVFFLDSDDFLHCNALEKLTEYAEQTNTDIVQCDFLRGTDVIFPEILEASFLDYDNHSIFTSFAAKIITCGKLYKRNVIGDIRFPEGLINEDDFTTWKFYYNSRKIAVTNTPYYYYTVNPSSIMANQQRKPNLNYFNAYRERISFFDESGDRDLEAISRIQLMKSLLILYSNEQLIEEERTEIKTLFDENYRSKSLKAIAMPLKLQIVFQAFYVIPMFASRFVKRLYKA